MKTTLLTMQTLQPVANQNANTGRYRPIWDSIGRYTERRKPLQNKPIEYLTEQDRIRRNSLCWTQIPVGATPWDITGSVEDELTGVMVQISQVVARV